MTDFNGLDVKEIERRCRPLINAAWDDEEQARVPEEAEYVALLRSMRSECGFLAPHESLLTRIERDTAVLEALNWNAQAAAEELDSLLEAFEKLVSPEEADRPLVTRDVTWQDQRSPFVNLESDTPDSVWFTEHHVANSGLSPPLTLRVGGDRHFGSLEHIRRFAFFGGNGAAEALADALEQPDNDDSANKNEANDAENEANDAENEANDAENGDVGANDVRLRAPVRFNAYRLEPALLHATLRGAWSSAGAADAHARLRVERASVAAELRAAEAAFAAAEARELAARAALAGGDELAELELDEAHGERLFQQQTCEWLRATRLAQLDEHLAQLDELRGVEIIGCE